VAISWHFEILKYKNQHLCGFTEAGSNPFLSAKENQCFHVVGAFFCFARVAKRSFSLSAETKNATGTIVPKHDFL